MTSVLDLIGETPLIEVTGFDRGPCRLFLKLESANPSGSIKDRPGARDDRGGRSRRPAETRRHDRRGHGRQYRPWARARRRAQGVSHRARRARQDGAREDPALQGHGRRSGAHALRRRPRPCRLLSGSRGDDHAAHARRTVHQSIRQSRQSAGPRDHDRPGDFSPDAGQHRCRRGRCRLGRHADWHRTLHGEELAEDTHDSRRPGRLGARATGRDRTPARSGKLGG